MTVVSAETVLVTIGSWWAGDWHSRRGEELHGSRIIRAGSKRTTLELTLGGLRDLIEDAKYARSDYDHLPYVQAAQRVLDALAKQGHLDADVASRYRAMPRPSRRDSL